VSYICWYLDQILFCSIKKRIILAYSFRFCSRDCCSDGFFYFLPWISLTHSWSLTLLEKLPIVQPLKKFSAFYGTRRFITVFTRALHWSLSWARAIQSTPSHPISLWSILILSTYLRLGFHQSRVINRPFGVSKLARIASL
jgi:hypothetical protein